MVENDFYDDLPTIGKMTMEQRMMKLSELKEKETETNLRIPVTMDITDAKVFSESWDIKSLNFNESSEIPESIYDISRYPLEKKTAYSREMEEHKDNDSFFDLFAHKEKPYEYTTHTFGFIPIYEQKGDSLEITYAGAIQADESLKNSRIKITLDALRIADYPGKGDHQIFFEFSAQNQLLDTVEQVHFNSTYRAHEGGSAAVLGYPIFIGLNVGTEGIAFRGYTINVKNEDDEKLLGFMDADVFKNGLTLITTAQPAIAPLSGIVVSLTKVLAERHRNVGVQNFNLGLDFSDIATRARLSIGSYVIVQIPDSSKDAWDWSKWKYNISSGNIVNKEDSETLIPYNYLIFSVSPYTV